MALSTREMLLVLRARDEMSRVLRGISTGFGDVDAAAMKAARNQMAAGSALLGLGAGMAGAGVAGLQFLASATLAAAEFERQVAKVRTQIDSNVKPSLESIGAVTKRVAQEVAVPLKDMNETLFFIFSSMDVNLKEAEVLLRGFAKEAVAGQTDIQSAAKTSIAILNTFQLPVSELSRLQDVQFQIIRKGVISYEELSNTIGRALPATRRAGQSFEQLGGMIAFLTRNGLSAAMAATSAARAMEAFAHPKTVQRMEKMGIQVKDAAGNFRPLNDVITDLGKKLLGLPQPERVKILQELFKSSGGTIQARRFFDTVMSGNEQLQQYNDLVGSMVDSTGVFEEAYKEMSNTTMSQSQILKNQWEIIKVEIGQALLPVLKILVGWLQNLLNAWNSLSQGQKETIVTIIAVGSAALVVVGGILAAAGAFLMFKAAAAALGIALGALSAPVILIIAAIAGIVAGIVMAWKKSETFRNSVAKLGEFFKSLWPVLVGLFEKFKEVAGPAMERVGMVIGEQVMPALVKFFEFIRPLLVWLIETIGGALIGAFQGLMTFLEGAFQFISGLLNFFVALFTGDWSGLWESVKQIFEGIWNMIVGAFEFFWNMGIVKLLRIGFDLIKGIVVGGWNLIKGIFTGAWNGISSFVGGAISNIVGFISSLPGRAMAGIQSLLSSIGNFFRNVWNNASRAVSEGAENVLNWFRQLPGRIAGAVGDLASLLYNAGRNIITGLWNGIVSIWNWVKDKIAGIAQWVRDLWPFSPAKRGPLKDHPMDEAGENLMKMLGSGIAKGIPDVMRTMNGIAFDISRQQFRPGSNTGAGRGTFGIPADTLVPNGLVGGAGVVQMITVYTNEIDPRRNAAELGWALSREVT